MEKHIKHLRYILVHKWFVLIECCKLGIPWLGITHDLSKFAPIEWHGYAERFFGSWEKDERPRWVVRLYKVAWRHHVRSNPHHWEHWLCGEGSFPMPERCCKEMLADWVGASKAKRNTGDGKNSEVSAWYQKHKDKIKLHPETRRQVEEMLKEKHSLVI